LSLNVVASDDTLIGDTTGKNYKTSDKIEVWLSDGADTKQLVYVYNNQGTMPNSPTASLPCNWIKTTNGYRFSTTIQLSKIGIERQPKGMEVWITDWDNKRMAYVKRCLGKTTVSSELQNSDLPTLSIKPE
jgi:hypothetical protein